MNRGMNVFRRVVLAVLPVVLISGTTIMSVPATAHSDLLSSNPTDGSTVSEVSSITLSFVQEVVPEFTSVSLTNAATYHIALDAPAMDATNTTLSVTLSAGMLADGSYSLEYYIVSIDGHPIEGTVQFAVAGAPVPVPTSTEATAPIAEPQPSDDSMAVPLTVDARSTRSPDGGLSWVWIGTGIASVVVLAAVSTVLLVAIRRRRDATV